jgi:predicted transcriptional regulator
MGETTMKVSELVEKLGVKVLNKMRDSEITGVYVSDVVSDIVEGASPGDLIVTAQPHKTLIATANLVGASAILLVNGRKPDEGVIELADRARLTMLATDLDSWGAAVRLMQAGFH